MWTKNIYHQIEHSTKLASIYLLFDAFFWNIDWNFLYLESIWRGFWRVLAYMQKYEYKYHLVYQKKAPNNIFTIKSQNLETRGMKS